jgi:hypothetical protein
MADEPKVTLTDGSPVTPEHREIDPATGMQKGYVVLSAEERAKGFVRPVREAYRHVGVRPRYPMRELREEEEYHKKFGYVAFEAYPESESPVTGRFWTEAQLRSGCGSETVMGRALAETYARDPKSYGATFCCACRKHFPVEEFVWSGTDERVGS